jgi:hypothetical protein
MMLSIDVRRPAVANTPATPRNDPHEALAERVLDAQGVALEDHVLMRENLATYFTQAISRKTAERIAAGDRPAETVLDYVKNSKTGGRWEKKIEREIAAPYTDQQVHDHLAQLGSGLSAWLARIDKGYPMRVEITGSITKGRCGANSDVDVMVDVGKKPGSDAPPPAVNDQDHEKSDISLTELNTLGFGQKNFMRLMMGPRIPVPDKPDAQFLSRTYDEVLGRKGLRFVDDGGGKVHVERFAPAPKRHSEVPFKWMAHAIDLALDEDHDADEVEQMKRHDGIGRKLLGVAMSATGIAAAIPGPIGWVTVKLLDKLVVRQTAP